MYSTLIKWLEMWEILKIQIDKAWSHNLVKDKDTSIRNYNMVRLVLRADKYTTRKNTSDRATKLTLIEALATNLSIEERVQGFLGRGRQSARQVSIRQRDMNPRVNYLNKIIGWSVKK